MERTAFVCFVKNAQAINNLPSLNRQNYHTGTNTKLTIRSIVIPIGSIGLIEGQTSEVVYKVFVAYPTMTDK